MGGTTSRALWMEPDVRPDYQVDPIFDPHYGFTKKRIPRKMIATEEEMDMANIPPKERDYCTHLYIKYMACRYQKFPGTYFCKPEKDEHDHCQYEDYIHRMKEFERERRLLERAKKKRLAEEQVAI